jgi:hypothetical protein
MENRIMRGHHCFQTFILLVLLAACGDSRPDLVLVHASDPHLLDGKRQAQEPQNLRAFAAMMGAVGAGTAGSPPPEYLVISGDLGLEGTDPRFEGKPAPNAPPANDTAGARVRRERLADVFARQINASPFNHVLYVPGNNDVFLEDAADSTWNGITAFAGQVQPLLKKGKTFRDLTACYRPKPPPVDSCFAVIGDRYVLVGFPSLSFKNAPVDTADYRKYLHDSSRLASAAFGAEIEGRILRQDTLHLAVVRRFAEVLAAATAGERRKALVLTHIPDLDDPFFVGQAMAREPAPAGRRLTPRLDAWNAGPEVFSEWTELVNAPNVLAVLAGHFHDSHREVYYQPYAWSRSEGRADRWKTFVTPPLAIKSQEASPIQARGFSVITLRGDSVRRQLYWFRQDSSRYEADDTDERSRAGEISASAAGMRSPLNPWRSREHVAAFVIALVSALLAGALWLVVNTPATSSEAPRGTRRMNQLESFGVAAFTGAVVLAIAQAIWGWGRWIWPVAVFWFVALSGLLLSFALIASILRARRPRAIR